MVREQKIDTMTARRRRVRPRPLSKAEGAVIGRVSYRRAGPPTIGTAPPSNCPEPTTPADIPPRFVRAADLLLTVHGASARYFYPIRKLATSGRWAHAISASGGRGISPRRTSTGPS